MNRQKLVDNYLEFNIKDRLDAQVKEALDEIKLFSKQIGDLESLEKTKFPEAVNTIEFLKLCIKLRQDAINKWVDRR